MYIKILYYAAVYVRGHFCRHVIIRVSYLQSLYSIVVHGYVVHSVLASYNYYFSARIVYVKTGRGAYSRDLMTNLATMPPYTFSLCWFAKEGGVFVR